MTPAPTGIEALLDELEALRERATPGEWKRLPGSSLIECDGRPIAECEHIVPGGDLRADFDKCHANADYIAAIINAAPSMFATLRSQSRALAERDQRIAKLEEQLRLARLGPPTKYVRGEEDGDDVCVFCHRAVDSDPHTFEECRENMAADDSQVSDFLATNNRELAAALAEREETIGRLREALTEMVKMHHRTDDGTGRWDWALGEAESALASAPKGEP